MINDLRWMQEDRSLLHAFVNLAFVNVKRLSLTFVVCFVDSILRLTVAISL